MQGDEVREAVKPTVVHETINGSRPGSVME